METTDATKRKFLTLLTTNFAAPVLIVAFSLIVKECLPSFMVNIGGHEQSLTNHIFLYAVPTFIYMFIYVKLWSLGSHVHNRKYKTGLVLLMIACLYGTIPQVLYLWDVVSPIALSFIHAAAAIVSIIGLFMFINNSYASRNLKIFIKCTPFIGMLLNMIGSLIDMQFYVFVNICCNIIIFLIVYRMVRKEIPDGIMKESRSEA